MESEGTSATNYFSGTLPRTIFLSDIVFSVGEKEFRAHKNILYIRCKILYEIAKNYDNDDGPIQIHSVTAEIFKSILDFVYTMKTPEIEDEATATDSLVAADRYECVDLKLYVESVIVDKFLAAENAAEFLIFADSYSCVLLKEAAINLLVADAETVKKADSWSKVRESHRLLEELLDIVTCPKKVAGVNETSETEQLDVTTLREKLSEAISNWMGAVRFSSID